MGGGQAGLAVAFYLRRAGLVAGRDVVVLDDADRPGGSWQHMWRDLRIFSPATASSLPGWMMPPWRGDDGFPPRQHVVDYLSAYEERYALDVVRRCRVLDVADLGGTDLVVRTTLGDVRARVVVSATGTWRRPFWPRVPGADLFRGRQLHANQYRTPEELAGLRVVVVGGGNSGAQLLAEVSRVAETTWVTPRPPRFLPDDVDGRVLFGVASRRVVAAGEGHHHEGVGGLGDIVMVAEVKEARERGVLVAEPMFTALDADGVVWPDHRTDADVVLWCTGFRPDLGHLQGLHLGRDGGHPRVGGPSGTQSLDDPRVLLVGYGDWTGPASATLVGAGRTARGTVEAVLRQLDAHG